jgi:heme exporter protein C
MQNSAESRGRPTGVPWAGTIAVVALMTVAGYAALFAAPEERTMGVIQRIFYFHAPSGMTAFVAFFLCFVSNILYLFKRDVHWDWMGVSAAEVGMVFNTVVLVTGPIWSRPVWGIWWTWDARLTSTFVLWLLYISYLLLRTLVVDPERRATVSAVFGILSFLDVPLVYMSIRWWRTQHPQPVLFGGPGSGLDPQMRAVFYTCWVALVGLMALIMRQRFRVEALRHEVEVLRMQAEGR